MTYTRTQSSWADYPSTATPIDAVDLENYDQGLLRTNDDLAVLTWDGSTYQPAYLRADTGKKRRWIGGGPDPATVAGCVPGDGDEWPQPGVTSGGGSGGGGGSTNGYTTDLVGTIPFDSFAGTTDDQKMANCLSYIGAATYKPKIGFRNRAHSFTGPYTPPDGLVFEGVAPAHDAGSNLKTVFNISGQWLWNMPSNTVGNASPGWHGFGFKNIKMVAGGSTQFVQPVSLSSGLLMTDAYFDGLSWNGFSTIMQARHLRVSMERFYVQGHTSHGFHLAGSDNYYFIGGGLNYASSTQAPGTAFTFWLDYISSTKFGAMYITAQTAGALNITGGNNLSITGARLDCTGRTGNANCNGPLVQVSGSVTGLKMIDCTFYGGMSNPAAAGLTGTHGSAVDITGTSAVGIQIINPTIQNGPYGANTSYPAIMSSVPVEVINPGGPPATSGQSSFPKTGALKGGSNVLLTTSDTAWTVIS